MNNLPSDFDPKQYKSYYKDLSNLSDNELCNHYVTHGIKEKRIYKKVQNDFDPKVYIELNNDLKHLSLSDATLHYLNYGKSEKRKYKHEKISSNKTNTINNKGKNNSRDHIVFVVARYNEDISNFAEFNDNLMVYNKGNDDISPKINRKYIKKVPNLGREAGTYCNYILDNYDNLPDYMIFTQGNPCDHIAIFDPVTTFNKLRDIFNEKKNYRFKYISGHKEPLDLEGLAHIGLGVYVTPIELGQPKNINILNEDIKKWVMKNCPHQLDRSNEVINKLKQFGSPTIWPWEFNRLLISSGWYCTSGEAQTMRHVITRDAFDYSKIKWLFDRPEGFSFGYGAIFIVHRDNVLKYSRSYWQRLFDSLQELLPGAGWGCERLWGFLLGEGDFYPKR